MDHKFVILELLERMRKKEVVNKDTWKVKAYSNALKQICGLEGPIQRVEDVEGLKGIGKGIKDKIKEIIDTGKLHQVEEAEAYNMEADAIEDLTKVHGVGPSKAKELIEKYNIKTIDQLKSNMHLLNDKQKLGLKYVEDFILRIPRKEMEKHEDFLIKNIKNIYPHLVVEVVGSYRRGSSSSGDIDVLITTHNNDENMDNVLSNIVKEFEKQKYCVDTFALGNKKYLGVCKVKFGRHYRRIDLLITNKHEFPFAELYFTGDQSFNIELRNYALSKGYSLSEYGLKHTTGKQKGNYVENKFTTEKEIFEFLGVVYIPPNERKINSLKFERF